MKLRFYRPRFVKLGIKNTFVNYSCNRHNPSIYQNKFRFSLIDSEDYFVISVMMLWNSRTAQVSYLGESETSYQSE